MKKNHKIILASIILMIVILFWGKIIHNTYMISPEEKEKIAIDKYNFEQLKKVKEVLKDIPEEEMKFTNLKELNKKYDIEIEPIKNCYYVLTTNFLDNYEWESSYIFWFQLESNKYKNKYKEEYYAYPKYDLPVKELCAPSSTKWNPFTVDVKDLETTCTDMRRARFESTISNPCED